MLIANWTQVRWAACPRNGARAERASTTVVDTSTGAAPLENCSKASRLASALMRPWMSPISASPRSPAPRPVPSQVPPGLACKTRGITLIDCFREAETAQGPLGRRYHEAVLKISTLTADDQVD